MATPRRARVVLACAAALTLLTVTLAIIVAVQRVPSQDMNGLNAIGIAPVSPPRPVPSVAFTDGDGRSLSLADFRGRAVVVNFWATWCVPCQQEMPSLDRLQAMLGGPDFLVLAVSVDKQGLAVVQPFYRELGLRSLGVAADPSGKALAALGIEGIPATLLVDPQGREIGRKLGVLEWDAPAVVNALRNAFGLVEHKP
jgi:thiol-disulfide isomerase/thioredoxin